MIYYMDARVRWLVADQFLGDCLHVRQLKGQICKLAKFSVTNQEYNSNTKSKPLYIFGAALR